MKALQLIEYNRLELVDMDVPTYGDDEVLIHIKACALCGSDIHGYDGSTGRRIPPLVMGHEASGIVEAKGSNVKGFNIGDRVTFDSTIYCRSCDYCSAGRVNLCSSRKVLGVSCKEYKMDGALAEYVALPAYILYKLPDAVSFEEAALIEPLAIAMHAVAKTRFTVGDDVVVLGAGTIGQMLLKILRNMGCGRLIAVDIDGDKLRMAKANGASETVDPSGGKALEKIKELTFGKGADIAYEAVGMQQTFETALGCLKKGGSFTIVGNFSPRVDFALQDLVAREITMNGSCASAGEYELCLKMLENKMVDLKDVISVKAPLAEASKWFKKMHDDPGGMLKVIILP